MYNIGSENGHPLRVLRTQLDLSQKEFADKVGVSETTIVRAESGHRLSPKVRRQLCDRLGKTSEELGLFGRKQGVIYPSSSLPLVQELEHTSVPQTTSSRSVPVHSPSSLTSPVNNTHTITLLAQPVLNANLAIGQQENAWLVQGTSYLGQLFNEGWSMDEILASAQIVLQGMQGMPAIARQHLLEWEITSMLRGIPVFTGKHVSEEERQCLCESLTNSIRNGWKLLHSAGNKQVLAVGQALLSLVQQNHAYLPSRMCAMYYSSVYNLIGVALHFQEQYQSALDAHISAYIASLATGDPWHVVQSLICQMNVYQALGQHTKVVQTIEEALRTIGTQQDVEYQRSRAHLLGCWADNSTSIGEYALAQQHLEASEILLEQIGLSEEFDATSWLHLAGNHALAMGNYSGAISFFERALSLPQMSKLRQASASIALATSYLYTDEVASLTTIEQNFSVIEMIDAPLVNKQLAAYIQQGLLATLPDNRRVKAFVSDVQYRVPALNRYIVQLC